jgi:surfeit locus 1 family protein
MKVRTGWPGWVPTLAAALGLALTLAAANWQFNRAAYKQALGAQYAARQAAPPLMVGRDVEPEDIAFRSVTASGTFQPEAAVWLDNRVRRGRAGFEVIMPLALANGAGVVLVNRGWVPANADHAQLPPVATPSGIVVVQGIAVVPSEKVFELDPGTAQGRAWQNFTLSRYRQAYPALPVKSYVIQQHSELPDELDRRWPVPGLGIEKHQIYAVQWLIFASLIAGFYVYFGFIRRSPAQ